MNNPINRAMSGVSEYPGPSDDCRRCGCWSQSTGCCKALPSATRLNEYDKEEWWGVCRKLRPDLTREEYERLWDEFQPRKREKELQ